MSLSPACSTSSGAKDFAFRGQNTFPVLADLLAAARGASREAQAATIYLLCRVLFHRVENQDFGMALAAMVPVARMVEVVENARAKKSEKQIVLHDENFMLWSLLRTWRVDRTGDDTQQLTIDLIRLHLDAMTVLPFGFGQDAGGDIKTVTLPVQALYRAMNQMKPPVSERGIDGIRPFFNDGDVRKLIAPVEVECRRPAIQVTAPKPKAADRPMLRVRGKGTSEA